MENSRVQLACAADGVPQPSLYWEKDGSPFSESAEEPIILPSGELLITSAQVGQTARLWKFKHPKDGWKRSSVCCPPSTSLEMLAGTPAWPQTHWDRTGGR